MSEPSVHPWGALALGHAQGSLLIELTPSAPRITLTSTDARHLAALLRELATELDKANQRQNHSRKSLPLF